MKAFFRFAVCLLMLVLVFSGGSHLPEAMATSAPDWMSALETDATEAGWVQRLTELPDFGQIYLSWQPMQGALPPAPTITWENSRAIVRGLAAWGVTEDQMRVYNFGGSTGFMEDPNSPELEDAVILNVSFQWLQANIDLFPQFYCQDGRSIFFGYEYQPAEDGDGAFVLDELWVFGKDGNTRIYDLAISAPKLYLYDLYWDGDLYGDNVILDYDAQGRLTSAHFTMDWEKGSLSIEYGSYAPRMNVYGVRYIDISDEKEDARYRCAYSIDFCRLQWWSGFHDHGPDEINPPDDFAELVLAYALPFTLVGKEGETYSTKADELFLYQRPI